MKPHQSFALPPADELARYHRQSVLRARTMHGLRISMWVLFAATAAVGPPALVWFVAIAAALGIAALLTWRCPRCGASLASTTKKVCQRCALPLGATTALDRPLTFASPLAPAVLLDRLLALG